MKNLVLAIALAGLIISCSNNDDSGYKKVVTTFQSNYDQSLSIQNSERLNFVLDSISNILQIKGLSCSIYIPNKGMWEGSYGFSHETTKINNNMAMTIGSNTKTYIATLILKLQENGKLNINNKVSQYLANVPYLDSNVTIKQLLNHTSGFGDFSFNPGFIQAIQDDFYRVWQPEETFPYFEPTIALPGEVFSYSDQNYLVAGLVIEAVTNKSLKYSMRDLILIPAKLSNTVYYPFEQTNLTIPHSWSADYGTGTLDDLDALGYSRIAFCSADNAAGGMLSTAKENVVFWDKLMNGKIINQTSLTLMKEFVQAPDASNLYGLGIQKKINAFNNTTILSHNGYVPGSISDNCYDENTGIGISVLTNQDLIRDLTPIISALHTEALKIK